MTDNDRDQIDQDAQIFMRTCSEAIKQLRNEGVSFISVQQINLNGNLNITYLEMLIWSCSYCMLSKSGSLDCKYIIVVISAEKQVIAAQIKEHRGAVLDLIETYLKGEFVANY